MAGKKRVVVASYDAVGGPASSYMGGDGFRAGPTDAGEFVLAYCGRHSSYRYAAWSKIRWGSELKEEGGEVYVMHKKKWRKLKDLTTVTKTDILDRYELLYGTRKLPKKWVFNDFGHMTCYFFKDKNKNRRLDKKLGEKIHGEFFHTTPDDEANHALGKPVVLDESHGCVHLKPVDIDIMMKKKFMKSGNRVVVHKYTEKSPKWSKDTTGKAPFEVHFFPGVKKLFIVGRR